MRIPLINLLFGWLWIGLGFLSGFGLGMFFHRDNWLGGYGSLRRRLYRLGHISFFGLGAVNLLFFFTIKNVETHSALVGVAAWSFIIGGLTMPMCCLLMAHFPSTRLIFGVPVLSLMLGGALLLIALAKDSAPAMPVAERPKPTKYMETTISGLPSKKASTATTL